mgnify:CR=1 FL=1
MRNTEGGTKTKLECSSVGGLSAGCRDEERNLIGGSHLITKLFASNENDRLKMGNEL